MEVEDGCANRGGDQWMTLMGQLGGRTGCPRKEGDRMGHRDAAGDRMGSPPKSREESLGSKTATLEAAEPGLEGDPDLGSLSAGMV